MHAIVAAAHPWRRHARVLGGRDKWNRMEWRSVLMQNVQLDLHVTLAFKSSNMLWCVLHKEDVTVCPGCELSAVCTFVDRISNLM